MSAGHTGEAWLFLNDTVTEEHDEAGWLEIFQDLQVARANQTRYQPIQSLLNQQRYVQLARMVKIPIQGSYKAKGLRLKAVTFGHFNERPPPHTNILSVVSESCSKVIQSSLQLSPFADGTFSVCVEESSGNVPLPSIQSIAQAEEEPIALLDAEEEDTASALEWGCRYSIKHYVHQAGKFVDEGFSRQVTVQRVHAAAMASCQQQLASAHRVCNMVRNVACSGQERHTHTTNVVFLLCLKQNRKVPQAVIIKY
eukprot:3416762-Amphidinium_carterae.1